MDQTQYQKKSRAERIQEARESCYQQKTGKKQQDVSYHYIYNNESVVKSQSKQTKSVSGVKRITLIRFFLAAILFLVFFAMDHFTSPVPMTVTYIQELIQKNTIVEEMEQRTANYIEEKIIPVFHRLEP